MFVFKTMYAHLLLLVINHNYKKITEIWHWHKPEPDKRFATPKLCKTLIKKNNCYTLNFKFLLLSLNAQWYHNQIKIKIHSRIGTFFSLSRKLENPLFYCTHVTSLLQLIIDYSLPFNCGQFTWTVNLSWTINLEIYTGVKWYHHQNQSSRQYGRH